MMLLTAFYECAAISIVDDNAKTHALPTVPEKEPRRIVKRSASMPMDYDLGFQNRRRGRRRHQRRSSAGQLPSSRWSAEPSSPPRTKKESVTQGKENCGAHSLIKPVRQCSIKDLNRNKNFSCTPIMPVRQCSLEDVNKTSRRKLPEVERTSLIPMMPVRQQSLRNFGGCGSHHGPKMDTVLLITDALDQLDSLTDIDDEMDITTASLHNSLPNITL